MDYVAKEKLSDRSLSPWVADVYNKSWKTFVLPVLLCVAMIIFAQLVFKIIGVFLIVLIILVYWRYRNHKVVSVYEEEILIYDSKNSDAVQIVRYNEIASWELQQSRQSEDSILIVTNKDQIAFIYTLYPGKVTRYLNKYAYDKNKQRKDGNDKDKGNSAWDAFNYLRRKK